MLTQPVETIITHQ